MLVSLFLPVGYRSIKDSIYKQSCNVLEQLVLNAYDAYVTWKIFKLLKLLIEVEFRILLIGKLNFYGYSKSILAGSIVTRNSHRVDGVAYNLSFEGQITIAANVVELCLV